MLKYYLIAALLAAFLFFPRVIFIEDDIYKCKECDSLVSRQKYSVNLWLRGIVIKLSKPFYKPLKSSNNSHEHDWEIFDQTMKGRIINKKFRIIPLSLAFMLIIYIFTLKFDILSFLGQHNRFVKPSATALLLLSAALGSYFVVEKILKIQLASRRSTGNMVQSHLETLAEQQQKGDGFFDMSDVIDDKLLKALSDLSGKKDEAKGINRNR